MKSVRCPWCDSKVRLTKSGKTAKHYNQGTVGTGRPGSYGVRSDGYCSGSEGDPKNWEASPVVTVPTKQSTRRYAKRKTPK